MPEKTHGRRAAATPTKTPLSELMSSLQAGSGTVGRRAAVVVAAGGLLTSVSVPAIAGAGASDEGSVKADAQSAAFDYQAQPSSKVQSPAAGSVSVAKGAFTAKKAPKPVEEPADSSDSQSSSAPSSTDSSSSRGSDSSSSSSSKSSGKSYDNVALPDGSKAQQVIALAKQYVGVPYRYGGTTTKGWDCSGFTGYVYKKVGVSLPRTSGAQAGAGKRISRAEAQPGDLIYKPGHIGIYAGNGMMYDAPHSGEKTKYRSASWMMGGASFIRVL